MGNKLRLQSVFVDVSEVVFRFCKMMKIYVITIAVILLFCSVPLSLYVQTGTLTEDGLDLWGIQRVENGR